MFLALCDEERSHPRCPVVAVYVTEQDKIYHVSVVIVVAVVIVVEVVILVVAAVAAAVVVEPH